MGFLSKLFSRSSTNKGMSQPAGKEKSSAGPKTILRGADEQDISALQSDKIKVNQSGKTGTTLRQEAGPEISALEMAERRDWEVKSLPVYEPGDEIMDLYKVEDVRSGAMGHVYIATHKKWKRKLAIKAPNEMILANRDFYARVIREAKSWTEMGLHPNIAYCYYVRNIDEVPHIVVEYVDGGNLRDWILGGKCLDSRTSLNLAIQFCHGMEYAHSREMIHRDIKPENILMTKDGILKITDFGLVRTDEKKIDTGSQNLSSSADTSLTRLGDQMGTPDYMAPEQFSDSHGVDERADIYAFGLCLYEMFCGNRPELGKDISPSEPATLRQDKAFPPALAGVLKKSIQWNRDDRFDSCATIRRELTRIYEALYNEASPFAELELVGMEADGLNNQGVSYMELGNKEAALQYWDKALKIVPDHLEAAYHQGLFRIRWEGARPTIILRKLENIGKNPAVNKEQLAEYQASICAESAGTDGARKVLAAFPGKYEELFEDEEVGSCIVMGGHTNRVNSVSLTPDGRLGLSGSDDNTVRLWNLETGKCLRTMEGHNGGVCSVSLMPDGPLGLFGSWDNTVRLWDLETGKYLRTMEGHTDHVRSVSLTPDGRLGLSGSDDNTVRLWNLETGKCLRTMEGHTGGVCSVSLTPDGRLGLSGSGGLLRSDDNTVHLWDLETGQCLRIMEGYTKSVNSVSLTPDGRIGLSGNINSTVRLWDIETGRCLRIMQGHTNRVNSVSLTPDGRLGLSGSYQTVRLWDLETGKYLRTMEGHTDLYDNVKSVRLTPDGHLGLSGSRDKTVRLWDLETGKCLRTMEGHTGGVTSVSLTPDGRLGLSGSDDKTLRLWRFIYDMEFDEP